MGEPAAKTKVGSYKDLLIWQKSMSLAERIYAVTRKFPADERFGLTSQMRRAAVSVPSTIAEGQARRGTAEFLRFLSNARGSLAELETQLLLSNKLGLTDHQEAERLGVSIDELQRMLTGMRRSLAER